MKTDRRNLRVKNNKGENTMKSTMKKLLALSLALVMLLALVSCGDKSAAIKKAFEKEEYKVTVVNAEDEDAKTLLKVFFNEEQMKNISEYEIMLCKQDGLLNAGKTAIVVKYPSAKDLKAMLTVEKDGKKDTSAYDKAVEDGTINGNCLIITLSSESKEIFKKA